jgi:hypothetical protein
LTVVNLTSRANLIFQKAHRLFAKPRVIVEKDSVPSYFEQTELTRHDHHNLEVKMLTQAVHHSVDSTLDVFLFVPGSFQLSRWSKMELQSDFRSRLRLAVPLQSEEGNAAIEDAKRRLRQTLEQLASPDMDAELLVDCLTDHAKEVGAVTSETLKQLSQRHRTRFRLAHALTGDVVSCVLGLREVQAGLAGTSELVNSIREILCAPTDGQNPVLSLLDEFISHLYVQYLGSFRSAVEAMHPIHERFQAPIYFSARAELETKLLQLQKREAEYRAHFPQVLEKAKGDAEREHQVLRLSQLKKFFQSRMFLDISRKDPRRRLTETAAALGAACAALWAAIAKQFEDPHRFETSSRGMILLSVGILIYVLKDRVKEWTKTTANQRANRWIPDFAQQLIADGRTIGAIREWFYFRKLKTLPGALRRLRSRAYRSEIEGGLPEEIFHYQRKHSVQPGSLSRAQTGWALQESIRINVERYLKHMDDPFKELAVLDSSGRLSQFRSHRVYDFYIGIHSTLFLQTREFWEWPGHSARHPVGELTRLYRVILDKKGIDRVEEIGSTV